MSLLVTERLPETESLSVAALCLPHIAGTSRSVRPHAILMRWEYHLLHCFFQRVTERLRKSSTHFLWNNSEWAKPVKFLEFAMQFNPEIHKKYLQLLFSHPYFSTLDLWRPPAKIYIQIPFHCCAMLMVWICSIHAYAIDPRMPFLVKKAQSNVNLHMCVGNCEVCLMGSPGIKHFWDGSHGTPSIKVVWMEYHLIHPRNVWYLGPPFFWDADQMGLHS